MNNDVAIFDLDGTLIQIDSGDAWLDFLVAQNFNGATQARSACREIMPANASGNINIEAYMQHWLAPIKGLSLSAIQPLINRFVNEQVCPYIFQQGLAEITAHQQSNTQLLLVSATPALLVTPIAKALGFDASIGINVVINDDIVTNQLIPPISFQQGKVACIRDWLAQQSPLHISHAYSDSTNDIPMLQMATNGYCINPSAELKKVANTSHWQCLHWHVNQ